MQTKALLLTMLLAALSFSPGCLGGDDASSSETVPEFTMIADDGLEYGDESLVGTNYILHFSASWCNQCRPTMHAVTNHLDGELYIVVSTDANDGGQTKLQEWHTQVNESNEESNVDAPFSMSVNLAEDFEINNTPTLILIGKDGAVIDRHIGPMVDTDEIEEFWSMAQ
jgi:thiol-disulfide isomerase/thioredoxin